MCSVRPEHIKILLKAGEKGGGRNIFEARIQSIAYYGFVENYLLNAFGGIKLKATHFNPEEPSYREGDNIYISFDPEDVDVFSLK